MGRDDRGHAAGRRLTVRLTLGAGDDDRVLRLEPAGCSWAAREPALRAALASWKGTAAPISTRRPVLILGIETSSSQVSCVVGNEQGLLSQFAADRGPRHAEALVPAVATVLEAAGIAVADLDAVAVSQGPGLFTGLRVGIATAQALALARGIPLQGVATLDLVAQTARLADRPVVAVTEHGTAAVFFAPFRPCPPGRPQRWVPTASPRPPR